MYGDALATHLRDGVPELEARQKALRAGLITAAVTYAGGPRGVEAFFRQAEGRELLKRTIWERGRAFGRHFKEEALEESTDNFLQGLNEMMSYSPGKSLDEVMKQTWEGFWMGGTLGGSMGAVRGGGKVADATDGMTTAGTDANDILNDVVGNHQTSTSDEDTELSFSMGTQPAMVRPIDNPTPSATLQGDEARNPKAIFRALTGEEEGTSESHTRGGESTVPSQRRKPGRRIASIAGLVAWADAHGRNVAPEKFSIKDFEASGGEHLVFFDEESGRAVKITKPGVVGMQAEDAGAYIQRWKLANEAFGDDVTIEGIVTLPGEDAPRVVTSQPWRAGRDATDAEIRDYLHEKGFHEHEGRWIHPIRRIKIWDTITPGNVIITGNGPMAVDLQAEPASNEDVQAVREETGFGRESAFSLSTTTGDFFPSEEVVQKGVSAEDAAELQRRLTATPIGRALLEGALFVPDRSSLDGKEGRPGQSNYSEKNWRDMERAEGFHDPRKGGLAAAVFLNNVEVRRGETPLEAVGRVLSHERMGHKEFNKLLKAVPELSQRWQQLVVHIPEEQLKGLRQRYKDVDGREEAPSLEWFADRAGALESRAQLQPGSLLDQMWQTVSDVFRTILEPLSRDPSRKMSQEALDAHVRAFLRRMRKNMLEETKGGRVSANGGTTRSTLLGKGPTLGDSIDTDTKGSLESRQDVELHFAIPESSRPPLVIGTSLNSKQPILEREEGNLGDSRVRERIAEAIIAEKAKAVAITDDVRRNEALERLVKKYYRKEAYAEFMNMSGKDIVYLTMPSSSGVNRIPEYLAKQLAKDFGGKIEEGDKVLGRLRKTQAKLSNSFIEKSQLSPFKIHDIDRLRSLKGKDIVLVDDIITSGDSTDALVMLLRENGISVRRVAALAARNDGAALSQSTIAKLANTLQASLKELDPEIATSHNLTKETLKYAQNKEILKQIIHVAGGDSRDVFLQKAHADATLNKESAAHVFKILLERFIKAPSREQRKGQP